MKNRDEKIELNFTDDNGKKVKNGIVGRDSKIIINEDVIGKLNEIDDEQLTILKREAEVQLGKLENQKKALNKLSNVSTGFTLAGLASLAGMYATSGVAHTVLGALSLVFNSVAIVGHSVAIVKNRKVFAQLKKLKIYDLVLESEISFRRTMKILDEAKKENENLDFSDELENEEI